jgi:DNA-binding NtrC family response regulator
MDNPLRAVLIHESADTYEALEGTLRDLSVENYGARTWNAAKVLIGQYQPLLVFVDLPIWRKSHTEIARMASVAHQFFNIVIVAPLPDIELYVSAVEQGAFGMVAPPFTHESLTLVVHPAVRDARERRAALAQVASPPPPAARLPQAAP